MFHRRCIDIFPTGDLLEPEHMLLRGPNWWIVPSFRWSRRVAKTHRTNAILLVGLFTKAALTAGDSLTNYARGRRRDAAQ
jgi:hypothetical protein